jgi:hypothetical protein
MSLPLLYIFSTTSTQFCLQMSGHLWILGCTGMWGDIITMFTPRWFMLWLADFYCIITLHSPSTTDSFMVGRHKNKARVLSCCPKWNPPACSKCGVSREPLPTKENILTLGTKLRSWFYVHTVVIFPVYLGVCLFSSHIFIFLTLVREILLVSALIRNYCL